MSNSTLLSIKEFSEFTGVHQSTLRYYDKIGLLPPAERGENDYRYYTPLQRTTLNFIRVLISLSVPIAEIRDLVNEREPENVIDLLRRQEAILDQKLHELRTAYSILHVYHKNIRNGLMGDAGDVRLEELGGMQYILGPVNDFRDRDDFFEPYKHFCNAADELKINLNYPVGGYHEDMNAFLNRPNQPERFFSIDPTGTRTRKAGQYLVGYSRGYYGHFGNLPQKMTAYSEEHALFLKRPVYVEYLLNEICIKEPEQLLSRISVCVIQEK